MKKSKNKYLPLILCAVLAVLAVCAMFFVVAENKKDVRVKEDVDTEQAGSDVVGDGGSIEAYRSIQYDGEIYTYNPEIKTVLFMGIDNNQDDYQYVGTAGHADSIDLFVINEKENSVRILTIPRECMVDIESYSVDGVYLGTVNEQLTVQYSFGESPKKSCWLMKKAVSSMLNDIPVNSYVSVNLEGIQDLTDFIGGVQVEMDDDYTNVDPAFCKGAVVDLKGELAEKFVRKRDINEFGSNEQRMDRQSLFFYALADKMKANASEQFITSLMDHSSSYLTTDMDVKQAQAIIRCDLSKEKFIVPGERVSGGDGLPEEYYVDEDGLTRLLIDMFYIKNGQDDQ